MMAPLNAGRPAGGYDDERCSPELVDREHGVGGAFLTSLTSNSTLDNLVSFLAARRGAGGAAGNVAADAAGGGGSDYSSSTSKAGDVANNSRKTHTDEQSRALISEQRRTIAALRSEVESLRESEAELRKRADDLRDKNVGMAKRLARRGAAQGKEALLTAENEHNEEEDEGGIIVEPARGGIDAYGRRVDDLRSANDALEWLVHSKDEEIENLDNARRVGEELVDILREQVASLRKSSADGEAALRAELAKSERKNATVKRSLEHCLREMDDVKAQLDELRTTAAAAAAAQRKEEAHNQDTYKEELEVLKAQLEEHRTTSERRVADLQRQVQDAKGELRKCKAFRTEAASAAARDLEEFSSGAVSDLRAKLEAARSRIAELEEKNEALVMKGGGNKSKAPPPKERGSKENFNIQTINCSFSGGRRSSMDSSSSSSSGKKRSGAARRRAFETWASSSWPAPGLPAAHSSSEEGAPPPPLLLAMLQEASNANANANNNASSSSLRMDASS